MTDHREIFARLRFYAIYNAPLEMSPTRWLDAVLAAGFRTVQVRDKTGSLDPRVLSLMARRCNRAGAFFLINDRVDLALEVEADGVHLGSDDRPVPEVRSVFRNWIIGRSARSAEAAVQAWRDGADYIGVGPVYATESKHGLPASIGWSGFARVADACPLPAVAIGGIQAQRLRSASGSLRAAGFAFMSALQDSVGISATADWIGEQQ